MEGSSLGWRLVKNLDDVKHWRELFRPSNLKLHLSLSKFSSLTIPMTTGQLKSTKYFSFQNNSCSQKFFTKLLVFKLGQYWQLDAMRIFREGSGSIPCHQINAWIFSCIHWCDTPKASLVLKTTKNWSRGGGASGRAMAFCSSGQGSNPGGSPGSNLVREWPIFLRPLIILKKTDFMWIYHWHSYRMFKLD